MKKILTILLVTVFIIVSLCSCNNHKVTDDKDIDIKLLSAKELPELCLSSQEYADFNYYISLDNIDCPYSELFGIKEAFAEKNRKNFEVQEHSYDFFENSTVVNSDKLYEVVKENNKAYMEGIGKHFNKELSNVKLKECCEIVADTINWGIENVEGIDLKELGCILGNLKILKRETMNFGTFNDKNDLLNISPNMIKGKKKRNGISNMYAITVSHEAMHILQCRCTDVEQSEDDSFIGTSYAFENLEVNPLKRSWLYEASAELNTALYFGCEPTTYQYMIDNLESLSLATILNNNIKARQLEKLCFTKDEDALYEQLEFSDKTKSAEFLFVVELLRNKPEDFKKVYENTYGKIEEDYSEFLKKTYNPYFVEVLSKLLYINLAAQLVNNEISLNDIFYIISIYELDLLKDIPLHNPTVREKYEDLYEQYIALQKNFFKLLQNHTDINIENSFMEYQMNYYDEECIYADATLEWLDVTKREYILYRNNIMYDRNYKHIICD